LGGTISLEASGSIGAIGNEMDTAGTGAISATSTGSDIYIVNTGNVTDLQLNADLGTITFANTGPIDTGAAITANSISLASSGTMTIDQAVTADSGTVTLSGALVDIDQNIDATGNIDLDASGNVNVSSAVSTTSGSFTSSGVDFTSSGGGTITTTGGNVDIQNTGNITIGAAIDNTGGAITTAGGDVDIQNTGNITIGAAVNADAGAVTITAGGDVTDSGAITANNLTVDTSGAASGGAITLDTANNDADTISMISGNDSSIQYVDADDVEIELADAGAGDVTITANGDVTDSGAITANNLTVDTSGAASGGAITLDTATNDADTISMISGSNSSIQYVDADGVEIDSLTAGDSISLKAIDGAITQSVGMITASGGSLTMKSDADLNTINYNIANPGATDLTLHSTGGSVVSAAADDWQSITATALSGITLEGSGDIATGQLVSTNGDISIESTGGRVAIGGDVTTVDGGGVSVTAASNIVTEAVTTEQSSVTTNSNIEVRSTGGDLQINGPLTAKGGGVSLIADGGRIYTYNSGDMLNVAITGWSNTSGAGVPLPVFGSGTGEAAIVIRSGSQDLNVGAGATLMANGTYSPDVDDRPVIDFDTSAGEGGDLIDVAIYLGSYQPGSPDEGRDVRDVTVHSAISMDRNGTMVIDAGETVTLGGNFYGSCFDEDHRLEVVSRISQTLDQVMRDPTAFRLPYADNPEAIRNAFSAGGGRFAGAYVLRGMRASLAKILALTNPVPLATPRPFTVEEEGEIEEPDTDALADLLSELGIGVQPYVTEAYAASLSTDLRLYRAAEKLQKLIPVLEDADGTRAAGLRAATAQFFPRLDDVISDERNDSFARELDRRKGDGTDFDCAGQCIAALVEYVTILSNDIGLPADKSIDFVMKRYVPRLTEGDDIRLAVIQIQLQKALGV
jgi:hypothetical protein